MLSTVSDLLHSNFVDQFNVIHGENSLNKLVTGIVSFNNQDQDNRHDECIYLLDFNGNYYDENSLIDIVHHASAFKMFIFILIGEDIPLNHSYLQLMHRHCKEMNVPTFSVKSKYPAIDLKYNLLQQITQSYYFYYKKTREVYNNFSYLSLKGKGLDAILAYFKEVIGNPVAIFDIDLKCIASTNAELSVFFRVNDTAIKENLNNLYYLNQKINISSISGKKKEISQILFPITIDDRIKAYLSVFETDRTLGCSDYFVLELAATAAMIEMKKRIVIKTIEERFVNDLIYDLVNNKIDDYGIVYERSKLIGLKFEEKHIVILFEIKGATNYISEGITSSYETDLDRLFNEISRLIYMNNHHSIVGKISNMVIALWPFSSTRYETELTNIKQMCKVIQNDIKKVFHHQVITIGIGKPAEDIKMIHKSYKEAKNAIMLGATILGDNAIIGFKDLGVLRLISNIEDRNSLLEIIPEELNRLSEHDKLNNTQLLETLSAYLQCNGNASKAANELFIHYKTMLYRLAKINKICNIDLEDYHQCMEIGIGIKILRLLENNNSCL